MTPGLRCPIKNQYLGNWPVDVSTARSGFRGIHMSEFPQAKREGMIPTRVRAVPFRTKVLFKMEGSALNRLIQTLCRSTKTGGAPGS